METKNFVIGLKKFAMGEKIFTWSSVVLFAASDCVGVPNIRSRNSISGFMIRARAWCTGSSMAGGRRGMETEGGVVNRPSSRLSSTTSP